MIGALTHASSRLVPFAELTPLHDRQRLVALLLAAGAIATVFELVRRRKLREEYSWVWVAVAVVVAALALQQDLLLTISSWIGASSTVSTLFFGALLFLGTLALQFSVRRMVPARLKSISLGIDGEKAKHAATQTEH